jgi:hypothetical protein
MNSDYPPWKPADWDRLTPAEQRAECERCIALCEAEIEVSEREIETAHRQIAAANAELVELDRIEREELYACRTDKRQIALL